MIKAPKLLLMGLVVLFATACAGDAGMQTAPASAALSDAPASSAGPSEPYPSQDYVEPEVPSPTAVPDPELVVTGLDTDQPCTASVSDTQPAALGIGLEDVPTMVSEDDLREAVAPVKLGKGREWVVSSGFQDNVSLADWRYEWTWPQGCDAFVQFGRVTGVTAEASTICVEDECPEGDQDGEELPQRVWASAHVFQTEPGAEAFLKWLSPRLWDALAAQCPWCDMNEELQAHGTPKLTQLQQGAAKVTSVTGRSNIGDAQMALVRQGRVVAEVLVTGPPDEAPDIDSAALAVALAETIGSAPTHADPYDITQVMSTPLRPSEIPGRTAEDDCPPAPSCPGVEFTEGGGSDNARFISAMGGREEQATAHVSKYGRSVSYSASYNLPPSRSVQTAFTQYASAQAASSALADLASGPMIGGYPNESGSDNTPSLKRRFAVPGVNGAVGVAVELDHQGGMAVSPHWIIYFTHGPGLATVSLDGDVFHEDDGEAYLDPFSSDKSQPGAFDGETLAIELARTFDVRLDRILG